MTETAPLNPEGSPEYEEVSENFFAELGESLSLLLSQSCFECFGVSSWKFECYWLVGGWWEQREKFNHKRAKTEWLIERWTEWESREQKIEISSTSCIDNWKKKNSACFAGWTETSNRSGNWKKTLASSDSDRAKKTFAASQTISKSDETKKSTKTTWLATSTQRPKAQSESSIVFRRNHNADTRTQGRPLQRSYAAAINAVLPDESHDATRDYTRSSNDDE